MLKQLQELLCGIGQRFQKPDGALGDRIDDARVAGNRLKTLENQGSAEEKLKKPGAINSRMTHARLQALKVPMPAADKNASEKFDLSGHLDKIAGN